MAKYLAEVVGTFALVLAATGSIMVDLTSGGTVTHAGVAAAPGLVIAAMIYAVGSISGAHFNPAVSIGFWSVGRLPVGELGRYIGSQLVGALLASLFLYWLIPDARHDMGAHVPNLAAGRAVAIEVVLTFLLMFVILGVSGYLEPTAGQPNAGAGVAVGGFVALAIWFAGPTSGASMNPARSFAPALFAGDPLRHLWIFVVGPVGGALLAAAMGSAIRRSQQGQQQRQRSQQPRR